MRDDLGDRSRNDLRRVLGEMESLAPLAPELEPMRPKPRRGTASRPNPTLVGLTAAAAVFALVLPVALIQTSSPGGGGTGTQTSSNAAPTTTMPPTSSGVAVPETAEPEILPLAWFIGRGYSKEERIFGTEVDDAFDVLVDRCMAEAGFDYPEYENHESTVDPVKYRYGLIDPDEAAVDGYTGSNPEVWIPPENMDEDAEVMAAISTDPDVQDAWVLARDGTASEVVYKAVIDPITGERLGDHGEEYRVGLRGGCWGEAINTIYSGADAYLTMKATYEWLNMKVIEIRREAETAARDEAESWQACMEAAGYPLTHPFWGIARQRTEDPEHFEELLDDGYVANPSWDVLPQPRPTPEEVSMAVADTDCKEKGGWTRAMFETEYLLQAKVASAAAEPIATARAIADLAGATARQILDKG